MSQKQKHSHKYQHYLPAVYIKYFKRLDVKGKACYVFDKVYPSPEQNRNGYRPRNPHEICGETHRHTIRIMEDDKYMIEEYFKIFEDEHDKFVENITEIYSKYERYYNGLRGSSIFNKSNLKLGFNHVFKCTPTHRNVAYRINNKVFNQYVKLICKVYLYRLKKIDSSEDLKGKKKLSALADSCLSAGFTFAKNFESAMLGEIISDDNLNIIDKDEINELMIAVKSMGIISLRKDLKDVRDAFEKIYRYIIYPLSNMRMKNKKIYILKTVDYVVSGDMPFCNISIQFGENKVVNSDVFTLTPNYMIIFIDENQGAYFNFKTNVSKAISIKNYKNAERYVFSNNLESLLEICKS